jgi:hypothetical protein
MDCTILLAASGINPSFPTFSINPTEGEFETALLAIGSQVPGLPSDIHELTKPFMALEPSHEDTTYLGALIKLGKLDDQFIQDVQMVDFTRPVLSDDRCGLLAKVPDLAPADRTVGEIRRAIIRELRTPDEGTPAAQLLKHLKASDENKPIDHSVAQRAYAAACDQRDPTDVLRDGLKLRSLERQLVFPKDGKLDDANGVGLHPYKVFEFEATMPVDNVLESSTARPDSVTEVALGARFSPVDCKLVSTFVPPK